MRRLIVLGIDVVIVALVAGTIFSGKPLWKSNGAAPTLGSGLHTR